MTDTTSIPEMETIDLGASLSDEALELLEGLNPEQAAVVQHYEGPLVTGAVAGAGKTTSLVRRIAYLVRVHGVDPARILSVTFSKKAADEMNQRLRKYLYDGSGARVGTFHSLAWEIVRKENPSFATWQLDDHDRYRQCVKEAVDYRGMDWKQADLTVVLQFIGRCKANCALPGTERAQQEAIEFCKLKPSPARAADKLAEAYVRSEEERISRRLITFDDMLVLAWQMLSAEGGSTLARWASKYDFVLQDESQDENLVQREIASMLSREHRNYMVVGDPAQSIFAFRGSDPSGLIGFEEQWGARKILMHRNYRSGDAIIEAANGILAAMPADTHLGASITPCRGIPGQVQAKRYRDMDAEADGVVSEIMSTHVDGVAWGDNLILYRTNAQSRALEDQMLTNRIPYVVIGGVNFYERKEVKDLLAYLKLSAERGNSDDVRRCINAPFRYLGKAFVEGLMDTLDKYEGSASNWPKIIRTYITRAKLQQRQKDSAEQWCALIEAGTRVIGLGEARSKPSVMLQEIIDATQYSQFITRSEGTESTENNRVSNVRELVRAAERFATVAEFLDYVEMQIEAAKQAKNIGGSDRVTLMSIHRSKGLEWPNVFVVGVNDKILPHAKCEDENEERRLAYVAFTRARDVLRVSCVKRACIGTRSVDLLPSDYIEEAGLELIEDEREVVVNREAIADVLGVEPGSLPKKKARHGDYESAPRAARTDRVVQGGAGLRGFARSGAGR